MKKLLAICACLALFSFVFIPRTNVYSQRPDSNIQLFADDRIVVKFKAGVETIVDSDLMAEEIVRVPGARAETLTRRRGGVELIHLNGSLTVEEAVRRAKGDPRVEYAEPDYFVYAMDTIPNDPRFSELWGMSSSQESPNISAPQAWDMTRGDDNIVAVVLDQGVDLQHEDLAANAWVNPGEIAGNGVDDDGNTFIDDVNGWNFFDGNNQVFGSYGEDFHGTHVAGSIGAVGHNEVGVTGVAWHVKLMALKFLKATAPGSTSNAVKGINYAIEMRNRGVNVRVINASWGGKGDSQALRDAIAAANNAGILFVCAAGNSGVNLDDVPDFPASGTNQADAFPGAYGRALPNVVSVAAVNQSGSLASFSNFGHSSVSVAAPGVGILSTFPRGDYNSLNGTSQASPYVSGIAVLLWSLDPGLTPEQVKERIVDTSSPLAALVSRVARSGRASAYDALINGIAPPQSPVILPPLLFTKKTVTLNGFGFVNGSAIIEVNGTPLPAAPDYDSSFSLKNGTLTRLSVFLGKKPLKKAFRIGVPVSVVVFNPTTGERSPAITVTRF